MRSWIIGNSTECDVVVDSPLASARHCQLTQTSDGFLLMDLGSTNGTYVNGVKITGAIRLITGDSVTLGRTVPLPWPPAVATSTRIGRLADNDIMLEDPRVSGHHARLLVVGSQTLIEDIGSSNGTFLNSTDRKVIGPTPITESDTVFFGTLAVPAARLLRASIAPGALAPAHSPVTVADVPKPGPSPAPPAFDFVKRQRWLLVWLAQAPVLAALIVLSCGRQSGTANWVSLGHCIAATTFALALTAIWLGGSLAIAAVPARQSAIRQTPLDSSTFVAFIAQRFLLLASLCALGCGLLLGVVSGVGGLKGPWPAMWCVLVLTALVGLFFGLVIHAAGRNWAVTVAAVLIGFLATVSLGGWIWPLPTMISLLRPVANAMPSRWAFEGLNLLETADHRAVETRKESDPAPQGDLVEEFFPANSERMGVKADVIALGSMLIGLAALAVFISGLSLTDP